MNKMDEPKPAGAVYTGDIFSNEVLSDSRAMFKNLRELGDAVWSPDLDLFIVSRYSDVVAALRAPDKLVSGKGVSANAEQNAASESLTSTIISDGDRHRRFKYLEMKPLGPSAVADLRGRINQLAHDRVRMLANGAPFEAVQALASYLPLMIVAEMVGIQGIGNEKMLSWSNALFDAFGPEKYLRLGAAQSVTLEFFDFMQNVQREDLVPGGWAARLFEAADQGEITHEEARGLMGDYIVPSLDTTIYSSAQMLYSLATVPGAWSTLRDQPELVPGIVDEAVRIATPLRGFTRVAVDDFAFSETTVPAGSRVWLLYAAANLDERKYPNPDFFDVERHPRDHLGFGHGVHLCLGRNLARLEMEALLRALLQNVSALEVASSKRIVNNLAQGFGELMMRMQPPR